MDRSDCASDFCVSTREVVVLGVKSESPPYETVMAFWSTLLALSVSVPLPPPNSAEPSFFFFAKNVTTPVGTSLPPAIGSISTSMLIATTFFLRRPGLAREPPRCRNARPAPIVAPMYRCGGQGRRCRSR